jgi:serine/tyrosine/threonine adenylyltransferase
MEQVNRKYVVRNYLAHQAIDRAEQGDYAEINSRLRLLARPFDDQERREHYAAEPPDWGRGAWSAARPEEMGK